MSILIINKIIIITYPWAQKKRKRLAVLNKKFITLLQVFALCKSLWLAIIGILWSSNYC